jgi:hypothetical protein
VRAKRSAARVGSGPFTPRKALAPARAALRFAREAKGECGAPPPARRGIRTLAQARVRRSSARRAGTHDPRHALSSPCHRRCPGRATSRCTRPAGHRLWHRTLASMIDERRSALARALRPSQPAGLAHDPIDQRIGRPVGVDRRGTMSRRVAKGVPRTPAATRRRLRIVAARTADHGARPARTAVARK